MRPLRHVPIQRRLRVVILATCSVALVVACGALFAFQLFIFRDQFERDLVAIAEIIGENSASIINFQNEEAAAEILTSLRAKPHITGAAIVLSDGTTLAQFGDAILPPANVSAPAPGLQNTDGDIIYARPIFYEGERLGTLLLHPDYSAQFRELLQLYATILAAILVLSFLVAALISRRLEPVILAPIRDLAEVTRRIETEHDYSVRAQKLVQDEIGSYTDAFNSMLDEIEHQDWALRREIAERVRAEEELGRVHRQLVDASRQAGMAEVATGVLHNVGNVLNSVNVSATLLAEKLTQSRTGNVAKAAAILRDQTAQLGTFLTEDPRGQTLPGYLADASQRLESERGEALEEVGRLAKNIEHLKDIVAMQQTHARTSSFLEPLAVPDLIEDAVRIIAGELDRHGIAIVRDFAAVPLVAGDKHKVLQILINLFRNAAQALADSGPGERRLTIRLRKTGDGMGEVSIADNGVGIPAGNLTRIFSHGFTTRKDGHGFGLHSAAVAAQEMRGRLTAGSAGPGQGATFTLALPLAPSRAEAINAD